MKMKGKLSNGPKCYSIKADLGLEEQ